MGSARAWSGEYASRYRHSKGVEIDLNEQHVSIKKRGKLQTEKFQDKLLKINAGAQDVSKTLTVCIRNTRQFLLDSKNTDFIKTFELIEKIKRQILEIVAVLPLDNVRELPADLVGFYTESLGGVAEDLVTTRQLAAIMIKEPSAGMVHPYQMLLDTAQSLSNAITRNINRAFIFTGDADFRELLGLGIEKQYNAFELNIGCSTIANYLENSYQFMYSLNISNRQLTQTADLDKPIKNSKEFLLYRMLLLKQLAKLADPNNLRVSPAVRRDIYQFVLEKFNVDPLKIFDDLVNQTLFVKREKAGPSLQGPLGKSHWQNDLSWVADAMRLDLAYASKPITPNMLINQAADEFLVKTESAKKIIFSYGQSESYLVPEPTEEYFNKLCESMASTLYFMTFLNNKVVVNETGTYHLYLKSCLIQVEELLNEIKKLSQLLSTTETQFNPVFLNKSSVKLNEFKQEVLKRISKEEGHEEKSRNCLESLLSHCFWSKRQAEEVKEVKVEDNLAYG